MCGVVAGVELGNGARDLSSVLALRPFDHPGGGAPSPCSMVEANTDPDEDSADDGFVRVPPADGDSDVSSTEAADGTPEERADLMTNATLGSSIENSYVLVNGASKALESKNFKGYHIQETDDDC